MENPFSLQPEIYIYYALNACGTRVNLPLSAAAGLELKVPPPKKKASLMPNTTRRIATE